MFAFGNFLPTPTAQGPWGVCLCHTPPTTIVFFLHPCFRLPLEACKPHTIPSPLGGGKRHFKNAFFSPWWVWQLHGTECPIVLWVVKLTRFLLAVIPACLYREQQLSLAFPSCCGYCLQPPYSVDFFSLAEGPFKNPPLLAPSSPVPTFQLQHPILPESLGLSPGNNSGGFQYPVSLHTALVIFLRCPLSSSLITNGSTKQGEKRKPDYCWYYIFTY